MSNPLLALRSGMKPGNADFSASSDRSTNANANSSTSRHSHGGLFHRDTMDVTIGAGNGDNVSVTSAQFAPPNSMTSSARKRFGLSGSQADGAEHSDKVDRRASNAGLTAQPQSGRTTLKHTPQRRTSTLGGGHVAPSGLVTTSDADCDSGSETVSIPVSPALSGVQQPVIPGASPGLLGERKLKKLTTHQAKLSSRSLLQSVPSQRGTKLWRDPGSHLADDQCGGALFSHANPLAAEKSSKKE